ncbi:leucine-rich repeat protein, putative [Bodo saltans]|uniref:Leucine-rich repeat protein, putative n=1 Tax=Bodo saltans TaxID=75058 RepID=A0A0S4JE02_BODSA|nr:leucine-rich repeat protein, putative [Bodo saltans]|eukprot:CUG86585.1 leucine-rich repeat protein, putative [Bodo saltans]
MAMKHSPAGAAYLSACQREQADCALELLNAFNQNAREVQLNHRARPLVDSDIVCVADALRTKHTLRVLNLEENAFGLPAVQALIDSLVANPGCVRELRLGKNRLRDPAVVILGNALALNGAGLKVLDVSENSVTKLGVVPLCQALSSKFCDLVEVSLHNNALEADAALPLSQAMRQSNKLKHLHLGYNSLRDSGAVQLARSIPIASSLATLDLTANRIGPQGGTEIAKALLSPNCTLQRVNLRHNNFDDATFEFFGDVIVKNTSLTQLFLGFMRPSREVATQLIATLRYNRSIVLFDMYGWGVEPNDAWGGSREGITGWWRTAARRGQCRHTGAPSLPNQPQCVCSRCWCRFSNPATGRSNTPQRIPSSRAIGSTTPRGEQMTPIVHTGTYDKDVDVLLQELQDVHMDSELRRKLVFIISQLQVKMDTLRSYHQQQLAAIEERIRVCELKPACQCAGNNSNSNHHNRGVQYDVPSTTFFVAEGRSSTSWNPLSGSSTPSHVAVAPQQHATAPPPVSNGNNARSMSAAPKKKVS